MTSITLKYLIKTSLPARIKKKTLPELMKNWWIILDHNKRPPLPKFVGIKKIYMPLLTKKTFATANFHEITKFASLQQWKKSNPQTKTFENSILYLWENRKNNLSYKNNHTTEDLVNKNFVCGWIWLIPEKKKIKKSDF